MRQAFLMKKKKGKTVMKTMSLRKVHMWNLETQKISALAFTCSLNDVAERFDGIYGYPNTGGRS